MRAPVKPAGSRDPSVTDLSFVVAAAFVLGLSIGLVVVLGTICLLAVGR